MGAAAHVGTAFEQDGSRYEVVAAACDVAHLHKRYRDIEQAGERQCDAVKERHFVDATGAAPVQRNSPLIANE